MKEAEMRKKEATTTAHKPITGTQNANTRFSVSKPTSMQPTKPGRVLAISETSKKSSS